MGGGAAFEFIPHLAAFILIGNDQALIQKIGAVIDIDQPAKARCCFRLNRETIFPQFENYISLNMTFLKF